MHIIASFKCMTVKRNNIEVVLKQLSCNMLLSSRLWKILQKTLSEQNNVARQKYWFFTQLKTNLIF